MSVDGQKNREQVLPSRYPAGFLVWLAAIALPVYIPASGTFFNANERGALEERRPILTNGIADACLACQSTARRTENKFYPVDTPQVF